MQIWDRKYEGNSKLLPSLCKIFCVFMCKECVKGCFVLLLQDLYIHMGRSILAPQVPPSFSADPLSLLFSSVCSFHGTMGLQLDFQSWAAVQLQMAGNSAWGHCASGERLLHLTPTSHQALSRIWDPPVRKPLSGYCSLNPLLQSLLGKQMAKGRGQTDEKLH